MELFDSLRNIRGDIASLKRAILDFHEDLSHYRTVRESKEQNTEDKIKAVLNQRFDFWVYLRDKVAPGILQLIAIALLYLIFAKP